MNYPTIQMNNITDDDVSYFSNNDNWIGGREYELRFIFPIDYPRASFTETLHQFSGLVHLQSQPENSKRMRSLMPMKGLPSVGLSHHYGDINSELSECTLSISAKQFARTVLSETEDKACTMDRNRLFTLHEALFALSHAVSLEAPVQNATICFEDWGWLLPAESGRSISISTKIAKVLKLTHTPVISHPWLAVVEPLA